VHNAGHTSLNRTLTSNEADRANAAREKWSSDIVSRSRFRSTLDFAADETGLYICSFPIRGRTRDAFLGFPLSLFHNEPSNIYIYASAFPSRREFSSFVYLRLSQCVCLDLIRNGHVCVSRWLKFEFWVFIFGTAILQLQNWKRHISLCGIANLLNRYVCISL